jgi:large subunit ribosomal protein L21
MSVKIKKILIDLKGVQIPWFPWKKTLRIPLQKKVTESGEKKEVDPGDKIVFDKIIQRDEEFGQPYLKIKVIGEVVKNGENKKIFGMKYKSKKRTKRTWGHREPYTEVKIVQVEG